MKQLQLSAQDKLSQTSISGQQQLVFLRPALPHARYIDRRPAEHRTLGLADAAADAELEVNAGLLQRQDRSLAVAHLHLLEPDGLLWRGTDLFTHDARRGMRPGKTPAFIDHRESELDLHFFFEPEFLDRAGRAHLSAERAAVF